VAYKDPRGPMRGKEEGGEGVYAGGAQERTKGEEGEGSLNDSDSRR